MNPDYTRMAIVTTMMVAGFTLLWREHETSASDLRSRIERLENDKADKVEVSDRWKKSEEIEYQKRVDSEFAAVRREFEILRYHCTKDRRTP